MSFVKITEIVISGVILALILQYILGKKEE